MDWSLCKLSNSSVSQLKYFFILVFKSTSELDLQFAVANSSGFEVDIFIDLSSRSLSGLNLQFAN